MSCGPGVSSWFSSHPTTGRAYAPIPMSDLKPKRDDDSSTEEVDEARAEEGFAPLERKLQGRHLTMIAIGGIIGPGLLVGSGNALATAGPGGALIAFVITGIIVLFVMQSLGELATYAPVSGSFTTYAGRFVDPALSFALGWNYWWLWVTVLCNEYNNVSLLLWYWPSVHVVPEWAIIILFWLLILGFAFLGVRAYGEAEYWLTAIKVLAITIFFVVALMIDVGGIGAPKEYIGSRYWRDPGAFADGISGVAKIFVVAGTLYAGCESVGVVAGESANPAKAVPRAIRSVFIRIAFFYIGTIFFIGLLIPYDNSSLLNAASKTAKSPFTIALKEAGIKAGASVMNTVIIITVVSAGNSSLFLASRILVSLAREGRAPRFLGRTNSRGVPWPALIFSNLFGLLAMLKYAKGSGSGKVFGYLMSLSGVSTFICWAVIALCHIRFRRAFAVQGRSFDELTFKALWYPYGTWFALLANVFLVFFQGYTTFLSPFNATDFVVAYLVVPVFIILYLGWKLHHRTSFVKLAEMDLDSDRRQAEREREEQGIVEREVEEEGGEKRGWARRVGRWGSRILA